MFNRRQILAAGAVAAAVPGTFACATIGGLSGASGFVRRDGMGLTLNGKAYRFTGTNAWYLPWLGADADYGDHGRLTRELDRLKEDGVNNIRVSASAELSPLKNSVRPAFRDRGADYNEALLVGLDRTLSEMGRRNMKAVLYLTNFWEWSGGMMTYLSWVNGGRYIDMNDPAHPWPEFADMNADFYRSAEAVGLYHDYVRAVVGRTNTLTGKRYADDPAIMAWQLSNEPRAAGANDKVRQNQPAFLTWVNDTARLIKSIAPNQLVSTGSEGLKGSGEQADIVADTHRSPDIDYVTAHIWPGNWGWLDRQNMAQTHDHACALTAEYIAQHVEMSKGLNKPLIIEEFGYPRDGDVYDPAVPTTLRDSFYDTIYAAALADARAGGPIAGTNFWAWNGEGRAAHPDFRFKSGDTAWLGDPPHEPQGWYGVFDADASTRRRIRANAAAMSALSV